MGHGPAVFYDMGNDVLAEIMARVRVIGVAPQFVEQEIGIEDVDSHAGQ